MLVFRNFTYMGKDFRKGDAFFCEDADRMRKLYQQRLIQPAPAETAPKETKKP